jgi:5,10-methylenetetrahydrofolate reductase
MNVIYEINPPKILHDSVININTINQEIEKFLYRAHTLSKNTNFIHITDSVLGIPRISSLHGAALITDYLKNDHLKISCSVRTRDRNINSLIQFATQAVYLKIKDLLFIMGDKPQLNNKISEDTPLSKPTDVIKILNSLGYSGLINLNLSIPNKIININNFIKKTQANPYGFITQSINSVQEVKDIKRLLEPSPIKLIPCIMIPSEKNNQAAKMIGLDWKEYENNLLEFILQVGKHVDHILITSPNSFSEGVDLLSKIKGF